MSAKWQKCKNCPRYSYGEFCTPICKKKHYEKMEEKRRQMRIRQQWIDALGKQ